MNLRIPVQDAIFALAVTGAAMLWPWLALLVAAAWLLFIAFLVDARTPASEPETGQEPTAGAAGEVKP